MTVTIQITAKQDPRRFSTARARREIRDVLQLMQQNRSGKSLQARCLKMQVDQHNRKGPKTTRIWPRKKTETPPKPPKIRAPKKNEVQRAKQLTI
ncbi:hypothetical protein [Thalassoglobus polymorphus]|uniref:Uncharacterized protein n=1 Tax=Thalassoglobus polymorphus TaxID=2527994 RepID=A0A517QUD7_9PLAN|nr:hypothetical protein [Thalassoglobus polymorphus]QDT35266.1 hypothetical protein Mal48_45420 [Thalassoglobus polymorphus]